MSDGSRPDQEVEVVRFYTSTRRFPKLIGKLPTGESIPGGPYTVAQFVWAMGVGVLLLKTKSFWGTSNGFLNIGLVVGGAVGVACLAGRLPATARNPLTLFGYIPEAWGAATGRYRGQDVKLPAVERVACVAVIDLVGEAAAITSVSSEFAPSVKWDAAADTEIDNATGPATGTAPLSAVQSLLVGAARSS